MKIKESMSNIEEILVQRTENKNDLNDRFDSLISKIGDILKEEHDMEEVKKSMDHLSNSLPRVALELIQMMKLDIPFLEGHYRVQIFNQKEKAPISLDSLKDRIIERGYQTMITIIKESEDPKMLYDIINDLYFENNRSTFLDMVIEDGSLANLLKNFADDRTMDVFLRNLYFHNRSVAGAIVNIIGSQHFIERIDNAKELEFISGIMRSLWEISIHVVRTVWSRIDRDRVLEMIKNENNIDIFRNAISDMGMFPLPNGKTLVKDLKMNSIRKQFKGQEEVWIVAPLLKTLIQYDHKRSSEFLDIMKEKLTVETPLNMIGYWLEFIKDEFNDRVILKEFIDILIENIDERISKDISLNKLFEIILLLDSLDIDIEPAMLGYFKRSIDNEQDLWYLGYLTCSIYYWSRSERKVLNELLPSMLDRIANEGSLNNIGIIIEGISKLKEFEEGMAKDLMGMLDLGVLKERFKEEGSIMIRLSTISKIYQLNGEVGDTLLPYAIQDITSSYDKRYIGNILEYLFTRDPRTAFKMIRSIEEDVLFDPDTIAPIEPTYHFIQP